MKDHPTLAVGVSDRVNVEFHLRDSLRYRDG